MRGAGVLVHELAGVGDQADVERRGDLRRDLGAEPLGDLEHDLGCARGLGVDQVDGAEAGVVVVVVDVEHPGAVALQELDRHPVDVAAVEEDERAVDDVGGRLVEDLLERQEAVLDRQRELLRREEHHRVLAELAEDVVHRQQRAERVAVGPLVGGEQEAVAAAQLLDDLVEVGRRRRRSLLGSLVVLEQPGEPHAALEARRRRGRSSVGVRLIRVSRAIAACRMPCEERSAGERRLALLLVAEHADVDARRAQVRAGVDGGHGHESDPRVLELGGDRRRR